MTVAVTVALTVTVTVALTVTVTVALTVTVTVALTVTVTVALTITVTVASTVSRLWRPLGCVAVESGAVQHEWTTHTNAVNCCDVRATADGQVWTRL